MNSLIQMLKNKPTVKLAGLEELIILDIIHKI